MNVYNKGVDITADVFVNTCEHDTYAGGRADALTVRFIDSKKLWDAWTPLCGDTIRITEGAADTGEMFVGDIVPENGLFTIFASALPPGARVRKTRAWENFRFLQIAADIAAAHGLTVDAYDVTDRTYTYIRQDDQGDFEFFNRLCVLEGCALAMFGKKMVVYDEQAREGAAAQKTIKIGVDGQFRFSDRSDCTYGAAEIRSGDFYGKFTAPGGDASRILRPRRPIRCASDAEAIRFARGLLRAANKDAYSGHFRRKLTCDFAAASTVNIEVEKAPSWNGKVFVTHARADYVRGISKIFFRRPLEGY